MTPIDFHHPLAVADHQHINYSQNLDHHQFETSMVKTPPKHKLQQ
jgi:hypothetical protein